MDFADTPRVRAAIGSLRCCLMTEESRKAFRLLFPCLVSTGMGQAMLFAILPPAAREIGLS